jgi:3-dehydroquinate synthase
VLDAGYFQELEADIPALLARDLPTLERVVAGSCRLKAQVVERDEREAELRWVLNYGHTIGHALEAVTGFRRWVHGEAVSLGIAAESRLAQRLGIASEETAERQLRLLSAVGLPVKGLEVEPMMVMDALTRDKKSRDGQVSFVFAPEIGSFRIVPDVPPAAVLEVLKELR